MQINLMISQVLYISKDNFNQLHLLSVFKKPFISEKNAFEKQQWRTNVQCRLYKANTQYFLSWHFCLCRQEVKLEREEGIGKAMGSGLKLGTPEVQMSTLY